MKVIPPIAITGAMLTSTIAEPAAGEVVYAAGTTYALGAVVIRTETHRKYESLTAGNVGSTPETNPVKWADVGPTNRHAMFDTERNSQSVGVSPLVVTVTPGQRINAVALMGLSADTATITVVSGGVTAFAQTRALVKRNTRTWYDYFFGAFKQQKAVIFMGIPPVSGATITVTLTGTNPAIGAMVVGNAVNIGQSLAGAEDDVLNYSKVDRDEFGNATLIRRRSVPRLVPPIIAEKSQVPAIREVRETLNAVPAVWIGTDQESSDYFDSMLILGIYKRFSINLSYASHAQITLELEEI